MRVFLPAERKPFRVGIEQKSEVTVQNQTDDKRTDRCLYKKNPPIFLRSAENCQNKKTPTQKCQRKKRKQCKFQRSSRK